MMEKDQYCLYRCKICGKTVCAKNPGQKHVLSFPASHRCRVFKNSVNGRRIYTCFDPVYTSDTKIDADVYTDGSVYTDVNGNILEEW